MRRAQSFKLVEEWRFAMPMTTRHSTSKGCPRSPRRDATEQSKAKLSPWTLGGTVSAQADRPRTARCKATREGRAQALSPGQRDENASCRVAGAIVALTPPQRTDTSCPSKQTKRRAPRSTHPWAYYPDRRVVASAEPTPGCAWRVHSTERSRQGEIAEIPFGRIP